MRLLILSETIDISLSQRFVVDRQTEIDFSSIYGKKSAECAEMIDIFSFQVYSFDGICTAVMLFVCTCAYIRGVPTLSKMLLQEKKGFFGTFYKGLPFYSFADCLVIKPLISRSDRAEASLAGVDRVCGNGHLPHVPQVISDMFVLVVRVSNKSSNAR